MHGNLPAVDLTHPGSEALPEPFASIGLTQPISAGTASIRPYPNQLLLQEVLPYPRRDHLVFNRHFVRLPLLSFLPPSLLIIIINMINRYGGNVAGGQLAIGNGGDYLGGSDGLTYNEAY